MQKVVKKVITIDLDSTNDFQVFISEENSSGSKYNKIKNINDLKSIVCKYIDDNFKDDEKEW